MPGIPPALDSDTEDVTWALQTAEALWKRNERSDALVWLRRAAQAAGEAEHDDRALELAHDAAELAEWISAQPLAAHAVIRDRFRSARPAHVGSGHPDAAPSFEPIQPIESIESIEPIEPRTTETDEVEEVSIDVAIESDPGLMRERLDTPTLEDSTPAVVRRTIEPARAPAQHVPSAAEKHAGMLDPWADSETPDPPSGTPGPRTRPPSRVFNVDEVVTSAPPVVRASPPPAAAALGDQAPPLDLSRVEAFSDLPEDAREAFARAAVVQQIAHGEELSAFALALILEGSVYLAATIVDTPAERLDAGEVMRARGTIEHVAPVRLVSATETALVATWDERSVEQAFRTCPWVEDDLRAAGDRLQALVGVTMGALGERLDPELRSQIASRLTVRALSEHEVFAARGKPIPGLLVVAVGELELVADDGAPAGAVLCAGDFLFPNEVLRAAPAPATVRAGRGGALVLFADRRAAQELLVTCPPLLEIFADA
ncbi:MAG TPA: cyclic nucleotide-binding domain-containing protein [Polyangiaceae bacterium]|nr:cyclic nucleotide-binding domain-containing protein [Polyangiaceae bacterium]